MKRQIANEGAEGLLIDIAADCLVMLSQPQNINHLSHTSTYYEEVFKCKTCNREFSSFQALGGHRASHHKKPKLAHNDDDHGEKLLKAAHRRDGFGLGRMENNNNKKPKMHECSICGQRFSLGQALGGHMRKHKDAVNVGLASMNNQVVVVDKVPVLKRSSSTRVMCLDLNLTPLENDLKLLFGTKAPKVDFSFS